MTSEGPRHASPDAAEPPADGAPPTAPWPSQYPDTEPTYASPPQTGTIRASASVPVPPPPQAAPPQAARPQAPPPPPAAPPPPPPVPAPAARPVPQSAPPPQAFGPPPPQPYAPPPSAAPFVPAQAGPHGAPAPADHTTGHRASGTVHMPDAAILPAHQLPPLPVPVPRVYGRPTAAPAPAPAQPHPQPYPQPQVPGAPHHPPPPPSVARASVGVPIPAGPATGIYTTGGRAMSAPPVGTQPMGPPGVPPPPSVPRGGRPTDEPPGGKALAQQWGTDDYAAPPDEGSGSHTGLLIAVGVVVLLAVVGLTAFMWPRGSSGPDFAVNSCVKQSGNSAVAADCGATGAFTIVSKVDRTDQCPDRDQPYVELGNGRNPILCLSPAAGSGGAPSSGAPTTSPNPATT